MPRTWIDLGRRDISFGDRWNALGPPLLSPAAGPCSISGCTGPGSYDGMCGMHWWKSAAGRRRPPRQQDIPALPRTDGRIGQIAAAYLAAEELLAMLPEYRWVFLHRALAQPPEILRRVRTILSIAARQGAIDIDKKGQYRIRIASREAALASLREAALATHYWRQAVSAILAEKS